MKGQASGKVGLFDVDPHAKRAETGARPKHVQAAAFTADGERLLTVGYDWLVRAYDGRNGRALDALAFEVGALRAVAAAPDGMTAACGGSKGSVVVWNLA